MAPYLIDALGSDINMVSAASASCAQCHIEYHFDQRTWEVIVPWSGLASMYPTEMLAYFNDMTNDNVGHDGEMPFADFTNPRSGVRQIKVQHPEFETVYSRGAVHNSLMPETMARSCADCHMPRAENAEGVPYISHEWMSPLNNMQLIQGDCFACHSDLTTQVREIQAEYADRLHTFGNHLSDLMERLVIAVESGEVSEEELNVIRDYFRNAQFFWDFVMSENSNGAHNSRLLFRTIEYGWEYADLVEAALEEIGF
jgi:nitrite reductase (cytochrome c-552)